MKSIHEQVIVCPDPDCATRNRVQVGREAEALCGRCQSPLFPTATDDHPLPFGCTGWLAIRQGNTETILRVLSLSAPLPMTWEEGFSALCDDYWDTDIEDGYLSRVFITP